MEALVRRRGDVRLRWMPVRTWKDASVRQFEVKAIPALFLYADRRRVAAGVNEVFQHLRR